MSWATPIAGASRCSWRWMTERIQTLALLEPALMIGESAKLIGMRCGQFLGRYSATPWVIRSYFRKRL
jgi:hypothetical protein